MMLRAWTEMSPKQERSAAWGEGWEDGGCCCDDGGGGGGYSCDIPAQAPRSAARTIGATVKYWMPDNPLPEGDQLWCEPQGAVRASTCRSA